MRGGAWKWVWCALTVGLLTALYVWRGGATLLFLCLMLGVLIGQGVVILLFGPRAIKIERSWLPLQPEAGEPLEVTLRVKVTGGIPVPWLLIRDKLAMQAEQVDSDQEYESGSVLLSGFRRQYTVKYVISNPERGIYGAEAIFVTYGDPLGYFKRTLRTAMNDTIYVHPAGLATCPSQGMNLTGEEEMNSGAFHKVIETSPSIERIREYLPGDPLHRIYWKGSARTGTLLARIPDTRERSIRCLWLDTRSMSYTPVARTGRPEDSATDAGFELAIQAAATIIRGELTIRLDQEAGDGELELRYGTTAEAILISGQRGVWQGLNSLAGVRTDNSTSQLVLPVGVMTPRAGVIYTLITGRITSELISAALQWVEAGVKLEIWTSVTSNDEAEIGTWLARLQRAGISYVNLPSFLSVQSYDRGDGHVSA
ncbi:DUF58 domain-containing protein [Paenibacillus sp. D2_2]|uniref:DUF58 domain-containing protein n=1 Tax=Paenibacillus sp. D2_2 TaxID=3073092 RepID=UPI002814FC39|nr:DUF58 domain-containing protein [Paenibacillus sp. D2_2]WMT41629.1 DUF58 domain-containing protein [Paenibacillus sp. D2_2]